MTWSFTVAGNPPTLNATYKVVHHPPFCPMCHRGVPRLGKNDGILEWQDAVAWTVKAARPSGWVPERRTVIEVAWWTSRPHDADAGVKALLDGIAKGLGCDDAGFLPRVVSNEVDKANPRTVVTVTDVP